MNKDEAKSLINDILNDYRKKDYLTLKSLIEAEINTGEIIARSQYSVPFFLTLRNSPCQVSPAKIVCQRFL